MKTVAVKIIDESSNRFNSRCITYACHLKVQTLSTMQTDTHTHTHTTLLMEIMTSPTLIFRCWTCHLYNQIKCSFWILPERNKTQFTQGRQGAAAITHTHGQQVCNSASAHITTVLTSITCNLVYWSFSYSGPVLLYMSHTVNSEQCQ